MLALVLAFALSPVASGDVRVTHEGASLWVVSQAAPLDRVLEELARQTGARVVYAGPRPQMRVSLDRRDASPRAAFLGALEGLGLSYALVPAADGRGVAMLTLVADGAARAAAGLPVDAAAGAKADGATEVVAGEHASPDDPADEENGYLESAMPRPVNERSPAAFPGALPETPPTVSADDPYHAVATPLPPDARSPEPTDDGERPVPPPPQHRGDGGRPRDRPRGPTPPSTSSKT